jgi:hypothetical protein
MNSPELFADTELNDAIFGEPQAEQDWLRAEQEEQQWLRGEQQVLNTKRERWTDLVRRA